MFERLLAIGHSLVGIRKLSSFNNYVQFFAFPPFQIEILKLKIPTHDRTLITDIKKPTLGGGSSSNPSREEKTERHAPEDMPKPVR